LWVSISRAGARGCEQLIIDAKARSEPDDLKALALGDVLIIRPLQIRSPWKR
jgi:hypothetical protein